MTTPWASPAAIEHLGARRPDVTMHLEMIDCRINDPKAVQDMTRLSKEKFDLLAWLFEREIFERIPSERMLFRGESYKKSDTWNMCLLRPRHVMFASLYCKAYKRPQTVIGHMLDVGQNTVSDYLTFIDPIEEKLPPRLTP